MRSSLPSLPVGNTNGNLWLTAIVLSLLAASPVPLHGQPSTEQRALNVAANGALAMVTTGVRQVICGCFSLRSLFDGAAGGAAMGVGKQVAGGGFFGSGMIGRQVHALGLSAIVSTGQDQSTWLVPLGPIMVEVRPGAREPVRARVDLLDSVILTRILLDRDAALHWGSSVSAGAPLFFIPSERRPPAYRANGYALLGNIAMIEGRSVLDSRRIRAHESIHVLQWDALRQMVTHPAERSIVSRIPGLARVGAYVDVGIFAPAVALLMGATLQYEAHPWEAEARLLSARKERLDGDDLGFVPVGTCNAWC